jgi:spermidine/putrescine transport system substrate-binding protein
MIQLLYVLLSIPLISSVSAKENELNIYLWEDTLSPKIVSDWETEHQTKINLFHFDNDDERSLLMLKSVQLPFDIVVLDNLSAQFFSRHREFEDLTHLANRSNNDPRWNAICGPNAIPYFWGSVGIIYRKDKFEQPPTRWEDLIKPLEKHYSHIGMIEDTVETLMPALYALNYSPVTEKTEELKAAYNLMSEFNKHILTYEYAHSYVRSHQDSDNLHMAIGYSGDHYSLNRFFHSDDWGFVTPQGQAYIWIDCMAINSNSKNKPLAKAFLNYLMRPDIAARNAMDIGVATPNQKAITLLPKSYTDDDSIFVDKVRLENAIIDPELTPENLNIRAKIINSLLNQYEAQP